MLIHINAQIIPPTAQSIDHEKIAASVRICISSSILLSLTKHVGSLKLVKDLSEVAVATPPEPDYYVKRQYAYAPQVDGLAPDPTTGEYQSNNPISFPVPYEQSNLVTSKIPETLLWQAPAIDIDVPCELIPSSQPGHYHLYIHKAITHVQYQNILKALSDAGIVEKGFFAAFLSRGYTALRHIGKHKPGIKHPGSNLLKLNAELTHSNFLLNRKVEKLEKEIEQLRLAQQPCTG